MVRPPPPHNGNNDSSPPSGMRQDHAASPLQQLAPLHTQMQRLETPTVCDRPSQAPSHTCCV